ncbi:MAG TPA: VOC family protein [Chitinophagaceae bacterium]|nr:VOC family protein [Chitinophagaceae bacterium]
MDASVNSLNWFEIPVTDMPRAKHFYQVIFSQHMDETEMMGMRMAMFPGENGDGKAHGALVQSEYHKPSMEGVTIYLNGDPDLSSVLEKIEPMGGKVLMPKTYIADDIGYMAFFADTEGNKVALHSQN